MSIYEGESLAKGSVVEPRVRIPPSPILLLQVTAGEQPARKQLVTGVQMRHKRVTQQEMQKDEMYLHKRKNGFYYFRRRVPADLIGIIDPKEFHYSLGTNVRREASARYGAAFMQSEHRINSERERLKQSFVRPKPISRRRRLLEAERTKKRRTRAFCQYQESDVLNLVSRWFQKKARQTEDAYRDSFALNNADEREEIVKDLDEQWQYLTGQLAQMDELVGFREVREILDEEDCAIAPDCLEDPLFRKFYGLVREGLLRLNQMAISLVKTGTLPESQNVRHGRFTYTASLPIRSVRKASPEKAFKRTPSPVSPSFSCLPRMFEKTARASPS